MDLRSGLPFFLLKNGLCYDYPKLEESISTEVVVLGGGISGALMAYHLINAGIKCVVIDGRTIGLGSTVASTSLLQYEIDVPLTELIKIRGNEHAIRAFTLCKDAINKLENISKIIQTKNFHLKDSLYFAHKNKAASFLKKEFETRKQAGFDVEFLERDEIKNRYGLISDSAILSHHGAQADAYSLTHALLQYSITKGLKVYDRSSVSKIKEQNKKVVLKTESGNIITADKLVNATGYEVVNFLNKKIVSLHSTYALISEHIGNDINQELKKTLLWNTDDPYFYMTCLDGRIMVGGRDEKFYNPARRDKLIKSKTKQLTKDFSILFDKKILVPEFSWAGTFGSTKDGLPFIGKADKDSNIYYALGFGGNGITFSLIAAEIVTDLILGRKNSDSEVFSFER